MELQGPNTDPVEKYAVYPFDTDEVYQQGLASILTGGALSNNPTPEEKEETLLRTRVFYFNKITGNSITVDEARVCERSHQQQIPSSQSSEPITAQSPSTVQLESTTALGQPQSEEEPHVLTFAELKELIETGRLDQIPNNKVIPDALNETPPSQSTTQARKKPWEIVEESQNTPTGSKAIEVQEKSS